MALLDGLTEADWIDALDMPIAQVAVADYCPTGGLLATRLLIRRRRSVSTSTAERCRRIHLRGGAAPCTDQRALPLPELAALAATDPVYGYSSIVPNLDVPTGAVEHWYRHRTSIEKDARRQTRRHLPGHPVVNRAWMWGALLGVTLTGWATPTHRHLHTRGAHCSGPAGARARP